MEGIAAATTTTEPVLQPTPVQNPMLGQRSILLPLQKVDPFDCVPKPEVGSMEDFSTRCQNLKLRSGSSNM